MDRSRVAIIGDDIEQFIRRRFTVSPDDAHFDRHVHLWDEGYVDSMGVIELIHYLEQTFDVALAPSVLFSDDFTTIEGMAGVVVMLQDEMAYAPVRHIQDSVA